MIDFYEIHPAKRTNYNGRWFKSNLEARTAEALDNLGIRWEYESHCFRHREYQGGQYTPDFYLPTENTYIEVCGRIDARHRLNAERFRATQNAYADTAHMICESSPGYAIVVGGGRVVDVDGEPLVILRCQQCGSHWTFVRECGGWDCRHCGCYIGEGGNNTGDNLGNNLFDAARLVRGSA